MSLLNHSCTAPKAGLSRMTAATLPPTSSSTCLWTLRALAATAKDSLQEQLLDSIVLCAEGRPQWTVMTATSCWMMINLLLLVVLLSQGGVTMMLGGIAALAGSTL
jgi:hypothetical protein